MHRATGVDDWEAGELKDLTPKQQRFVAEYLKDHNATQAYLRAGYQVSDEVARRNGHRLLTNADIAIAVEVAAAERLERTKIDADELLIHLTSAVRAKISDIRNDDGSFKPVSQWPDIWQQLANGGDVDVEDLMERSKDGGETSWDKAGTVTKTKYKFVDRGKLIELAMKHTQVNAMAVPKEEHIHLHLHAQLEGKLTQARMIAAECQP